MIPGPIVPLYNRHLLFCSHSYFHCMQTCCSHSLSPLQMKILNCPKKVWKISIYGKENCKPFCFVGQDSALRNKCVPINRDAQLDPAPALLKAPMSETRLPAGQEELSLCREGRIMPCALSQCPTFLTPCKVTTSLRETRRVPSSHPSAQAHLQ